MSDDQFPAFPSISRLNRMCIASEKIDGTNGVIFVADDCVTVRAGSRSRWITTADDNFGFAKWVEANREELAAGLGPGTHYGEWWGAGIQRRYGLQEKRFSLFNTARWTDDVRPKCCGVVPVLATGLDIRAVEQEALAKLREGGSIAAPGFMNPEGIVIFHSASGYLFKVTLENDESPKSKVAA